MSIPEINRFLYSYNGMTATQKNEQHIVDEVKRIKALIDQNLTHDVVATLYHAEMLAEASQDISWMGDLTRRAMTLTLSAEDRADLQPIFAKYSGR